MKLVRYGRPGREKPGMIDEQGMLRDLSGVIDDITPETLSDKSLAKLAKIKPSKLPRVKGKVRYGTPVNGTSKYLAIGINYVDHGSEAKMRIPKEPIVFTKAISSICGAYDDIITPKGSVKTDWEIELGVVIGKKAQYVSEEDALNYVAGYCVANDLSEREFQIERGTQWDKGKGCDTFGPLGPWLVTRDEVGDVQNLELWLEVNGERMQQSNTKNMIFPVSKLVSYLSHFMTLMPGDVIATGTPSGVGLARDPKVFLKEGDVVTCAVQKLGCQRQTVRAWSEDMQASESYKKKKVAKTVAKTPKSKDKKAKKAKAKVKEAPKEEVKAQVPAENASQPQQA